MLVWLDGRLNTNPTQPQENFAREVMELFTFGVANVQEADVKAAAKVFTGWNLRRPPGVAATDPAYRYEYFFDSRTTRHNQQVKTFTFDIYPGGGRTIPAERRAGRHRLHHRDLPASARRGRGSRASSMRTSSARCSRRRRPSSIASRASTTSRASTCARWCARCCTSPEFWDAASQFARYSWPTEFVVRAIKETGWVGLLGRLRADAAAQHGPAAVRAARRQRLGARPGLVLDRERCSRA